MRTRLCEEAEDLSFVDGRDRRVDPRLPGQEHSHRLRCGLADARQERGTVHHGHSHVRDDGNERPVCADRLEPFSPAGCGDHLEPSAQSELEPL